MRKAVGVLLFLLLGTVLIYSSSDVSSLKVRDVPYDGGGKLVVSWNITAEEEVGNIKIFQKINGEDWKLYKSTNKLVDKMKDNSVNHKNSYKYKIEVYDKEGNLLFTKESKTITPGVAFYNVGKTAVLVSLLIIGGLIYYFISAARRGQKLKIRRIPALDSLDEAVGRATEMGKPVLFVPGILDVKNPQTIAGVLVLSEVAYKTANFGTDLNVPVSKPIVLSTANDTVKEAYMRAGRPDQFNDDMVHYVTNDQFGYVSHIDGYMVREKPAAVFMLGAFYAESLILAETGHSIGAIQVAGTAMPSQIPFFITTCDYVLIGEELYAASAYLSRKPDILGALKGQDYAKLLIMIAIIVGAIMTIIFPEFHFAEIFTDIG
ncbi:MAG: hypothetical protein FXF47_06705 [Candidatus Mcinerneyibacterium aminivorans]|uniref:DUF6754 domain-containing protein n=1 Tax=Candidatus Mcinerneyibacterium aminivorans TaxID=2703815 RepID=A0A5D0MJX5_9BACT|nr:MAG: hypothetical protein FXF47_06705 [Candidatus Mcinerneyibacterium aminivorans]